jgi:hypothetical protein
MANEKCVSCGVETTYEISTHVDYRSNYVEGVGQLCVSCYTGKKSANEQIVIPREFIVKYSNNAELGEKVREFYYQNY